MGWIIAFFVLITFIESVRLEIFMAHDQPYTALPLFTASIPFAFYVLGIVPGALIAKHYRTDEDEYMKMLVKEYGKGD